MRYKLRMTPAGLRGKHILKEAFGDLLPRPILHRRKMGFGVPIAAWFRGELKDLVRDVLLCGRSLGRGYFEPSQVRRLVEQHTSGRADHGYRLWCLVMLELWHRRYVDGCESAV
jgi:asparagine synthase (glutamine-hydrolysing)